MKTTKTESKKTEYKIKFFITYDSTNVGGVMHEQSFTAYVEGITYEEAVKKLEKIVFDDLEEKENNDHYNGRCSYFSNPELLSSRKASPSRTFVKRGKRKIEVIK